MLFALTIFAVITLLYANYLWQWLCYKK